MNVLRRALDLDAFFCALAGARSRVLMVDYDGTLAPFRIDRDAVAPYPGVPDALSRLVREAGTRVVVVSGRPARDAASRLGMPERTEVWGCHGRERWLADGTWWEDPVPDAAARAMDVAWRWLCRAGWEASAERKAGGVALHWRGCPEAEATRRRRRALDRFCRLAAGGAVAVAGFDGGLELRVPGRDKGEVVRTVLRECGAGAAAAYLGDDLTDEDAFRAIEGSGLSVLVREQFRPTAAAAWLRPPGELLHFLARWHRVVTGGTP